MHVKQLVWLVAVVGAVALGGLLVWQSGVFVVLDDDPRDFMKKNLQRAAHLLCREAADLSYDYKPAAVRLPEGDAKALYAWAMQTLPAAGVQPGEVFGAMIDREQMTLRDEWGHELVYRFPAKRPEAIFDLYSVGPDGIDQSGGLGDSFVVSEGQPNPYGDDVTCVPSADWQLWAAAFNEGAVAPEHPLKQGNSESSDPNVHER